MCGIAGLIDCSQPVNATVGKQMTDVVSYRGPDDEGFALCGQVFNTGILPANKTAVIANRSGHSSGAFVERGGVFLGHRRLSILDLTDAGHQPMASRDGRFWIVFNGEVYNYLELRLDLEREGYRFKSGSDTEVILAAYACWREECLQRFNGMWGLAIFDARENVLFASRDRFGVKPFYYAVDRDRFGFSSEIKQLRTAGFGTGRADRYRVAQFLVHQKSNADRETLFEGIRQLLPGEALRWSINDGIAAIKTFQYYSPRPNREMRADGLLEEYQARFGNLLEDSIRLRLRSDVPVGTCLSGGLDSSSIVITVNRLISSNNGHCRQKSFTSCFKDPRFDEWEYAESVVSATGVEAHRVFPDMDRLWDEMDNFTWHQEEPCASTSPYAQWNVMRMVQQNGIKVLLDGQGSDEVMGGYHYFLIDFLVSLGKQSSWLETYQQIKALRRTGLWSVARRSFTKSFSRLMVTAMRRAIGLKPTAGWLAAVVRPEFRMPNPDPRPHIFQDHLYWTILRTLQPLLRYEDRNSMAFSVEARTPFLDYRLVELFLNMCGAYKVRDGWTKPFLREAMAGIMPEDVRLRVDKKGFVTPEATWYQRHFESIRRLLLSADSPVQLFLNPAELDRWLDKKEFVAPRDFSLCQMLSVHFWMLRFGLT